ERPPPERKATGSNPVGRVRPCAPGGSGALGPGDPLLAVEAGRLGLLEDALEGRDKAPRRLELWKVTDVLEDLQAAGRKPGVGLFAMGGRGDRVAVPPDEQEREILGEVEAVERLYPLALGADDRAQRGEECLAPLRVGEG